MSATPITSDVTPTVTPADVPRGGNRRLLAILAILVGGMLGLAYASVPLYQLFCQVTGYGGTTQVALSQAETVVPNHPVKVRFDANINRDLNWRFEAVDAPLTLNPGEEVVINYRATNLGDAPSTGTSTYNVTPVKAGPHFMKIDLIRERWCRHRGARLGGDKHERCKQTPLSSR